MTYYPSIEATLFENWPESVRAASIPTNDLTMSRADILALGSCDPKFRERNQVHHLKAFSSQFIEWLTAAIDAQEHGAFLRTHYGSFRECPFSFKPAMNLNDAISILRWSDTRILRHLQHRLNLGGDVVMMVRPWIDMLADQEFRVFIEDKEITAITPIHHQTPSKRLIENATDLNEAIRKFVRELIPDLALDRVALDLHVTYAPFEVTVGLTELTPYLPIADAGLFDWHRHGDMNGHFRYRTGQEIVEMDADGLVRPVRI